MARPESSTPVDCPVCGTTVSRKSDLGRHMDLHDPNKEKKKHSCPYPGCTYRALQRNNLKIHLNTHTGERPYKCPELGCDFSTGDPGSLTRHRTRVHAHEPKENSRSRPATITRKETRRQRRTAPYPSLSPSSTGRSVGSTSPLDPSLEGSGTPAEMSRILEQTTSLLPPAGSRVDDRDVKNAFAAYNTELIPKRPQVNDSIVAPDGYSQLSAFAQTQKESFLDLLAKPLPDVALDGATDPLFENFLTQFDHMQGAGTSTSSHITPPMQYPNPVYNPPASLPAPLLPTYDVQPYSMNDAHLPTPATLPAYEHSHTTESSPYEHYGDPTEATSFDSPFSYSLPLAASDMSAYPQAPYQTYSTPVEMSDLQMQGFGFH